ncbi:chromosomal replication initiator protein DnaA [Mycoplasmopsis columbina]|uniref:chromosomal replication initiator protein DnaA n=1 Tax=Mycoplasmopsis columbina TaxID=114881 RepID=UPI0004A73717|nr:chromosomal replication initiator protein DnaA [Mycoplasmopsis columbina]VEU76603.1 chromosomal replication initiator protein DnaA [Mycoplasmopsis columbina]
MTTSDVLKKYDSASLKKYTKKTLEYLKNAVEDISIYKTWVNFEIIDVKMENHFYINTNLSEKMMSIWVKPYEESIEEALKFAFGCSSCQITFLAKKTVEKTKKEDVKTKSVTKKVETENESKEIYNDSLNKEYTFENYVRADFNEEALRVAEHIINDGNQYNPLFIFAKSGLGKTHLIQAIAHKMKKQGRSVIYINPNTFTRHISVLLQENNQQKIKEMKEQFEEADIVMFDDFQSLGVGNKKGTLQVIFSILDQRISVNKVTIFSSDKPLYLLNQAFDERLISRLSAGLQIEIKRPSQDDLFKIVNFLIDKYQMDSKKWDKEAIVYITRNYANNIRNLLGALTRIRFHKNEIDKNLNSRYSLVTVNNILDTMQKNKENVTAETIIDYVAKHYKISKKDILGKSRKRDIVLARHIAMFVIREQLKFSLEKIASLFGNRDHSTVVNAIRKIEKECDEPDHSMKNTISLIKDDIYRIS